ncbi:BLOC-1-related complex subunit 5 isoform X4 [Wyeomyia smithii]|uniref:BLOC-1-related complex subunit 5 isoform X4 n=1 Tax=Wyeomyia smithii TaxID=174621 RepID=UPI002467D6F8|nr:BLOC-1-related complex subunit 5 isoform X4 [Wyeomyia smithii]XP_055522704.1 BLOC-1-related complex subunit 5 isoform X4 [Wyeomyia smithii]XP_055522709.1 BLOC-1-related complex subunit 5 isoform X4 [Wyeomyia smithii]
MGSEQSQLQQQAEGAALRSGSLRAQSTNATPTPTRSGAGAKLHRGNTIAATEISALNFDDNGAGPSFPGAPSSAYICDSRPVSPPMSVCSDSDLPYISYTDKPIGDSPKLRNKQQTKSAGKIRPNSAIVGRTHEVNRYGNTGTGGTGSGSSIGRTRPSSTAHSIVVVKSATVKETGIEKDDDIVRLQSIPQFLPVMRGTLSLPANRDPEVLERLQPTHMANMCSRLQLHFNTCATQVAAEQHQITNKIKEVDQEISSALAQLVQKQKLYTSYAETFSKVRVISQQLTRCNDILNQNIESMEYLNNLLDVEDRLEPFVWKTE